MVHNRLLNYHRRYMISAIDSNVNITHIRGGTKVMLPSPPPRRYYNSSYNKIYIYHGLTLYKVEIIFPQSLPLSTLFFRLCMRRSMPVAQNSLPNVGALHARPVLARRRPEVLGVHPSRGPKNGSRRVLNRDRREDEGEQSTPLIQLPPLCADRCAVWRYRWTNQSHSLF